MLIWTQKKSRNCKKLLKKQVILMTSRLLKKLWTITKISYAQTKQTRKVQRTKAMVKCFLSIQETQMHSKSKLLGHKQQKVVKRIHPTVSIFKKIVELESRSTKQTTHQHQRIKTNNTSLSQIMVIEILQQNIRRNIRSMSYHGRYKVSYGKKFTSRTQ